MYVKKGGRSLKYDGQVSLAASTLSLKISNVSVKTDDPVKTTQQRQKDVLNKRANTFSLTHSVDTFTSVCDPTCGICWGGSFISDRD